MKTRFLYFNSVQIFMLIMGVLLIFLVNFLVVTLNQQYVLQQYQIIYENKELIGTDPGIYEIPGTDFVVGINCGTELENGINFTNSNFTTYINGYGNEVSYTEIDADSLDDVYNNYLVYRYSSYMTPQVIFFLAVNALLKYVVVFGVLYLVIRIYEHMLFREGTTSGYSYVKRFTRFKFCTVSSFVSVMFYAYGSFVIENTLLLNSIAILIGVGLTLVQVKTRKRRV